MGFNTCARARLRRRPLILLATCVASLAAAGAANAATLTVNSTADQDTGSCGTTCTLRDAIKYSSAGDTVVVPAGTYTLSLGELFIAHNLTVNGAGAGSVTVSGGSGTTQSRVFFIGSGVGATLSGMTITGGNATGNANDNNTFDDGYGGGILSWGALSLSGTTVTGNTAQWGGGGIQAEQFGTLAIDASTISDNTVQSNDDDGAGLACFCMAMSVNDTTVSGNHDIGTGGDEYGGGMYISVAQSIGARPHAASAYALPPAGTAVVTNTTVSGNSVSYQGGGIYLSNGTLDMANTTISGNTADGYGGGIYDSDTLNSVNNTVANNSSPDGANIFGFSATGGFENTLVAEAKGGGQNCSSDQTTFPPSQGHNLEDDAGKSCGFTAAGDLSGVSADLGALADNGGPTQTMALLAGSPAIDHGATISLITTDQRGGPRPQPAGGAYDIGAYERGAVVDTGITKTGSPNPVIVGWHLTYHLTATNHGPSPDPAYGVTVVDKLPSSVKFDSAKPSQGSCSFSSGTLTCHLGTIDQGSSATVKVVVTPGKAGTVTNTGSVSSSAKDYNAANDQATVTTTVKAAAKPAVVTGPASQIRSRSARLHGKVKPGGASTTYYFQYGTTKKYGSRTRSAGVGRGLKFRGVAHGVSGLKPGTRYHYRIVAHNAKGTRYGKDRTFVTPGVKPAFTG